MLLASLRNVVAHKGRLVASVLAVVLGVAFVSGTLILSGTINSMVDGLVTAPDLTVAPKPGFTVEIEDQGLTGEIPTVPSILVAKVASIPGVVAAHGEVDVRNLTVVDRHNVPIGPANGAPTLGQRWYPRSHPMATVSVGRPPSGPGEIVLDQTSAGRADVHPGDQVRVTNPTGGFPATVVGLARFTVPNPGVGLVFFDTATGQAKLLGDADGFTAVSVDVAPDMSATDVQERLRYALGAQFSVQTRQEVASSTAAQLGSFLDVVTYALLGFGGVAVLVGIFLILNTFSMLVAQRTRELGLLRAIGASRGQITRMVLIEALLLGLVGSTLGLAAGTGLAAALKALLGKEGVDLSGAPLVIGWTTPVAAYAVGVLVTAAAAYPSARRAAQAAPMAALREPDSGSARSTRPRTVVGLVLLAVGAGALVAASTAHDFTSGAVWFGVGVPGTVISLVVLGPVAARLVGSGLGAAYPLLFGAIGRMSQRNAIRNPRRTGATAAALMIGVSLVGALGVVAASLSTSIHREVTATFGADFVLSGPGGRPVGPEVTDRVRGIPGVDTVTRQRYAPAEFRGFQVSVSGVDTATIDRVVRTQYVAGATAALADGQVMVDQHTASVNDLAIGSVVHLRFANGSPADLTVGAISRPPVGGGKDGSVFQVSLDTLSRFVPQAKDFALYLKTAPGADRAAVGRDLGVVLAAYPQVSVQSQADYQHDLQSYVDLVLQLVYGLLALAIVIAVLGVVNTLALSVVERTREIGLLRAVGTTRPQIRRLIRLESAVIAVHGGLLGLALGLVWGIVGRKVLVPYGIAALTIPWSTIGVVLAASVVVGLVAAIRPAHRAARLDVLAAIAAD